MCIRDRSSIASLKHWARIAEKMGVEVEPITKKDLAKLAHYDALFIREPVSYTHLDVYKRQMAEGKIALVLVSGFLMFGKKVPHWVLAIGDDGEHIIIHDPWVEAAHDETKGDAANIPIPYDVFMRMAQFGKRLRAAVILGKRQSEQ